MENRNLDKALDIVSKLIMGEQISESKDNSQLIRNTILTPRCMT